MIERAWGEYGGFNAATMPQRYESLPRVPEGVSFDDLLDGADRRYCRSRGDRMKERENREFWIRANDHPPRDVHQSISLYFHYRVSSGSAEPGSRLNPNGP